MTHRGMDLLAIVALLVPVAVAIPRPAAAHAGPPFPIIVDERVGPWLASVWTDPDIGIGEFWVVLEPADGRPVRAGTRVRVGVTPTSGRLSEAVYDATPQRVRYGERHYTEVAFDRGEWWHVRIVIDFPGGTGELTSAVEATPDGMIGPVGMVFYLLPFLATGFIWLRLALRRRELKGPRTAPSTEGARPSGSVRRYPACRGRVARRPRAIAPAPAGPARPRA